MLTLGSIKGFRGHFIIDRWNGSYFWGPEIPKISQSDFTDSGWTSRHVRFVPILLQKSQNAVRLIFREKDERSGNRRSI